MSTIISVWLIQVNENEVIQFLDNVAPRIEVVNDLQWNYPVLHDPLLFVGFDPYILDEFEEVEEIAYLISKDEELSFLVIYMRLRVSRKGRAAVEAARHLTSKLLSRFNGFVMDDREVFWDAEEIRNSTKKNSLQFLEAELGYCSS